MRPSGRVTLCPTAGVCMRAADTSISFGKTLLSGTEGNRKLSSIFLRLSTVSVLSANLTSSAIFISLPYAARGFISGNFLPVIS